MCALLLVDCRALFCMLLDGCWLFGWDLLRVVCFLMFVACCLLFVLSV